MRVHQPEDSIARVEQIGPALLSTIKTWLGTNCKITIQPVIDPDNIAPVDRYEAPDRMRDAILARTPASILPWTGSLNRRNDLDHTVPYLPPTRGPPGQTGLHTPAPTTSATSPPTNSPAKSGTPPTTRR